MRKTLLITVAVVLIGGVISSFVQKGENVPSAPTLEKSPSPSDDAVAKAKKALEAEKQIRGVFYDPTLSSQWQIGMENDGTSRAGYATYVCEVLRENGAAASGTRVKIIDVANLLVAEKDRNLRGMGTVACDDGRVISEGDMRPILVPTAGQ